jgi:long-chain fatty acid transport protein
MKYKKLTMSVAVAVAGLSQAPVYATNGMLLTGYGFRSQAMGGVGIAYGRDALSVAANPANAVNTGMRGDMGFGIFNAERHAAVGTDAGFKSVFNFHGSVESDNKYFLMPEMGMTMPLTEKLFVGMAFAPNGGGNSTYRENFLSYPPSFPAPGPEYPKRDRKLGVDLMQLIAPITLAYKVNENHAVGASLVLAAQRFRAYGLDAFLQFGGPSGVLNGQLLSDPAHLTDQGYDYSYGAGVRLGWLGKFMDDKLTLGLTYASKTYMTKFDKYRGLFAQQGDLDIPENYGIGIAFKPAKGLVVAADIVRVNYADVPAIGNRGPSTGTGTAGIPSASDPETLLGMDQGMGFGWTNQTIYKLGVNYGLNERWQIRAGYNYGKSPIPNDQLTFSTLAPATTEKHYSAGFTYKANDNLEVTGTYVYAASHSQQAINQNVVGGVELDMHQNLFALSLGWVLDPGVTDYGDAHSDPIVFGSGDKGFYAGFGFGQASNRDLNEADINAHLATFGKVATTNVDDRSPGWKVFSGYEFNRYAALEAGFVNFNHAASRSDIAVPAGSFLSTTYAAKAWTLAVVGSLPVTNSIAVFAKVGASNWFANERSVGYLGGVIASTIKTGVPVQRDGIDAYYGVGINYDLVPQFLRLRAEWERYDIDGRDVDLMTAGFSVKF